MRTWVSTTNRGRVIKEARDANGNRIWRQFMNGVPDGFFTIYNVGYDNIALKGSYNNGCTFYDQVNQCDLTPTKLQTFYRMPNNILEEGYWKMVTFDEVKNSGLKRSKRVNFRKKRKIFF